MGTYSRQTAEVRLRSSQDPGESSPSIQQSGTNTSRRSPALWVDRRPLGEWSPASLKLEAVKRSIENLVIDSAEKPFEKKRWRLSIN
jgi:hypothetical protein